MDKCDVSSPATKATSSSSHRYPSWVMLDRYTRLNYTRSTLDYPKDHFRLSIADAETSAGDPIRVSFRAVPPPGASRLYVRWTPSSAERRRTQEEEPSYRVEPLVVAAHGNAILMQLTLHFDFNTTRSDFYVNTVHSAGRPPWSLRRLPACDHRMAVEGLCGLEHMLELTDIGLICRGDGEFVVADLQLLPEEDGVVDGAPLEAQLCMLRSCSPDHWTVTRPRIRCEKGQVNELFWWRTDAVVPFGDSLCYVDFFRGILFADVLTECPELQYVRLPVKIVNGDLEDRSLASRCVCATKGGGMKFVEVVTTTVFVSRSLASSSFTINLWNLRREGTTVSWEKEGSVEDAELWSLQGYADLPRVVPEFPLVSMDEPNIVYFVLSNDDHGGDAIDTRIIVVDMLNKTLRSSSKYTAVNPFHDEDGNMASRNLATFEAFIPCEFSKYLPVGCGCSN